MDINNSATDFHRFHFRAPTPTSQNHFIPTSFASPPTPQHTYPPQSNPRKKRSKMIKLPVKSIRPTTPTANLKRKYSKNPDSACGSSKTPHPCSECGKTFWSWKALFGHMRCHPEREWRGINPPPHVRRRSSPPQAMPSSSSGRFEVVMTEDDHETAVSLLMLANGSSSIGTTTYKPPPQCRPSYNISTTTTTSSTSMIEWKSFTRDVEMGLAEIVLDGDGHHDGGPSFECSSCKKVFGSHQALGGHRASHKNVKGCFAITRSDVDMDEQQQQQQQQRNVCFQSEYGDGQVLEAREIMDEKTMMVYGHRCSICSKMFSSGQALGGHMRCHWEKQDQEPQSSLVQQQQQQQQGFDSFARPRQVCGLDLNLPAPLDDNESYSCSSGLTLDLRLGI